MTSTVLRGLLSILLLLPAGRAAAQGVDTGASGQPVREIRVPLENLQVLLENQPRRVLLSRAEYEDLLRRAEHEPARTAPTGVVPVSAAYEVQVADGRARIRGTLTLEVLAPGLQMLDLPTETIGLLAATLDEQSAALGRTDDGRLRLFVEGLGQHHLAMEFVTAVETSAALQKLAFRVPPAAAIDMQLQVPGDVEVRGGMAVMARHYDAQAARTNLRLLPVDGRVALEMTLNNRMKQSDRLVLARGVVLAEVTESYERLHATYSMNILHRPVERFRFSIPDGFEVTSVHTPLLADWAIQSEAARTLVVRLREPTSATTVVSLVASRAPAALQDWRMPRLAPRDTVAQASVLGVLLEHGLEIRNLKSRHLVPIDTAALASAYPASLLRAEPGAPGLRPVAAFYAPTGFVTGDDAIALQATFARPTGQPRVTTNLFLSLEDDQVTLRAGFAVRPRSERLFEVDLQMPPGWQVLDVTDAGGAARAVTQFDGQDPTGPQRLRVHLPRGVAVGEETTFYVNARHVPPDWLSDWRTQSLAFPAVRVLDVARDVGAIAIRGAADTRVFPDELDGLTPLDESERSRFGLPAAVGPLPTLAYRYDAQPYRGVFRIERSDARITARTYSFVRLEPGLRRVSHELAYQIEQARTAALSFSLPEDTPPDLGIRALGGVAIKQSESRIVDGRRHWTVHLASRQRGLVRLAVAYEQRQPTEDTTADDRSISLARAEQVAYQSGFVALEADGELDIEVTTHPRRVDVGELAPAEQPPWRTAQGSAAGGLGVFAYAGPPADLAIRVARNTEYGLPVAIVQRAELVTLLSAEGRAQTAARLTLRTRPAMFEIQLPPDAVLWSLTLDGVAASPQREGQRLLLALPATQGDAVRDLQIVYETPLDRPRFWDQVSLEAVRLALRPRTPDATAVEIPVADFDWHVALPSGFDFVRQQGTLRTTVARPEPAAWTAARALYAAGGGINPFYLLPSLSRARELAKAGRPPEAIPYAGGTETQTVVTRADLRDLESLAYVGPDEFSTSTQPAGGGMMRGGGARAPAPAPPMRPKPAQEPAPAVTKKAPASWALTGFRSLAIELETTGTTVSFHSLGRDPHLTLTLVDQRRTNALGWSLALLVIVIGLAALRRDSRFKVCYVVTVALVATLLPLLSTRAEWTRVANPCFWAALLLAAFYLLAALGQRMLAGLRAWRQRLPGRDVATTAVVMLALLTISVARAEPPAATEPDWATLLAPPAPVTVPADAIIVPYDEHATAGPGDRVLVPYERFQALWKLAYPDDPIEAPPAPFAPAGARYETVLADDDSLAIRGVLEFDLFDPRPVAIPLDLAGGVLTEASLDEAPASLGVAPGEAPQDGVRMLLRVAGAGRHRLVLTVRPQVERSGGWRRVTARLPAAPATALTIDVPRASTDVRIRGLADRRDFETATADTRIATALPADGRLQIAWRPRVQAGRVDPSLTVSSAMLLDVREDGLQCSWQGTLELGQSPRERFTIGIPAGYQVHGVLGTNVRGWTASDDSDDEGVRDLEVTLLKPAAGSEQIALILRRIQSPGQAPFEVPVIRVRGAVLHKGSVVVRRSTLLDVRTVATRGVSRSDVPADLGPLLALAGRGQKSPLAVRAFQAYTFAATPFQIRLAATATGSGYSAEIQSVFRIAERQQDIEARFTIVPESYPVYHVQLALPVGLRLERLSAIGAYEWSQEVAEDHLRVDVYLAEGKPERFSIIVQGTLAGATSLTDIPLPRIGAPDARRQSRQMVLQADPAFDLRLGQTSGCRRIALERVAWLDARQRPVSRTALSLDANDYRGRVTLHPRRPIVQCTTISNVRVVDTTVEETILLTFDIRRAGIRSLSFTLPGWLRTARISAPMLREQRIEPTDDAADAPVRVHLQLQDEIMGKLRVLVEHDRLLTADEQSVPIPTVADVENVRRFIALETAGRDEVVLEETAGLQVLTAHHKAWAELTAALGSGVTQAFQVDDSGPARLSYRTRERVVVETAGARIGLARTVLAMDASGVYRAAQSYRIDNTTEQFLEVDLPDGAELWSAIVAGQTVKPARTPGGGSRRVRIPLIRTAAGDLDYEVVLYYGGQVAAPGWLRSVTFPLMSTVNVPVELSQVRMHLPEDWSWFGFGGSMRPVSDQGDLAAGILRYQTRVAERLAQALEMGSSYTRSRAASSFGFLKSEISKTQSDASRLGENANIRRELQSSKEIVARNEQQLEDLKDDLQAENTFDNRARLNDLYLGQRTERARNTLQTQTSNFGDPQPIGETAVTDGAFDLDWIQEGQLDEAMRSLGNEERARLESLGYTARKRDRHDDGRTATRRSAGLQPEAPQLAGLPALEEKQAASDKIGLTDLTQQAAGQYRQQLARRSQADRGTYLLSVGGQATPGQFVAPGSGLAGVPVTLATRGVVYDFTTPRGATTLTARAVSREVLTNLLRLVTLVGGLLLLALAWSNRRHFGAEHPGRIALAGLVCLLTGILPLFGVALVVVAAFLAVRPRTPAAA